MMLVLRVGHSTISSHIHIQFSSVITSVSSGAYFFSTFSIIKLEIHYPNEIKFISAPVCAALLRVHSVIIPQNLKSFLKKYTPSPLSRNICLDNGRLIFYNQIMSYAVIWAPPCVAAVLCECIKEYLPFIHDEMENSALPSLLCNRGSQGLSVPLSLDLAWNLWNSCLTLLSQRKSSCSLRDMSFSFFLACHFILGYEIVLCLEWISLNLHPFT